METLEDFLAKRAIVPAANLRQAADCYDVFTLEENGFSRERPAPYCRRDFYKIALIRGTNRCHYADRSLDLTGSQLLFFSPTVPYTWEPLSDQTGYFCLFKEAFYTAGVRDGLRRLPMFGPGGKPSYRLTSWQDKQASQLFQKMLAEQRSAYPMKLDLARAYVTELVHFALKLTPSEALYQHPDANARLTSVFLELLERQFAESSASASQPLKSAGAFAEQLCVHVNHLNRAVRATTGRTTTAHIYERLLNEAKAQLRFTSQYVAEIGFRLGFQEPAHFYAFFLKRAGMSPSAFRKALSAAPSGLDNAI